MTTLHSNNSDQEPVYSASSDALVFNLCPSHFYYDRPATQEEIRECIFGCIAGVIIGSLGTYSAMLVTGAMIYFYSETLPFGIALCLAAGLLYFLFFLAINLVSKNLFRQLYPVESSKVEDLLSKHKEIEPLVRKYLSAVKQQGRELTTGEYDALKMELRNRY